MKKAAKWAIVSSFLIINLEIFNIIDLVGKENFSGFKFWHFAGLLPLGVVFFFVFDKVYSSQEKRFQIGFISSVILLAVFNMYSHFVQWSMDMCTLQTCLVLLCYWIGAILLTLLLTYLIPQKFFDKLESKDKAEG